MVHGADSKLMPFGAITQVADDKALHMLRICQGEQEKRERYRGTEEENKVDEQM